MANNPIDLDALVASNIITPSKRDEILEWSKHTIKTEGTSRFLQIFAAFGAIVTGLGFILLLAANWDTISDMTKTILMIGVTSLSYIVAYWLTYQSTHYPKTGQALFLLGSMLYGASIFLLGQTYNLGGTFASALLIWAIPTILLAYTTQFVNIFLLSVILIYSYIFAEMVDRFGFSGFVISNIFIAVGYLSLTILRYHRGIYSNFSSILSWTGGASILGGLFSYTFLDFWRYGGESWYTNRDFQTTMWILFAIVSLGIVAIIIDIIRKSRLDNISDIPLLLGLIPIGLIFFYTLNNSSTYGVFSYTNNTDMTMYIPTILMNILYLAILSLMIYLGVRRDNRSLVNISMIYLALYLFGKYLAFTFDSKIDGAYIFIGGGIACIILTILIEKVRRRLMLSME
ncbi:DUF2157 domain-containing protein [Candidatus Gracilibacteria bacterium]|nr:DUF2157 domain-containing protein [Candidatus Gracilibacteria bacterium]